MEIQLQKLKRIIKENFYFQCELCFLRGSFAVEKQKENSDIDLLIITDDFEELSYFKRRELVQKAINLNFFLSVDAICLSKKEYIQIIDERRELFNNERMVRII